LTNKQIETTVYQVPPNFHCGLIDPFSFLICQCDSTKDQVLTLKGHLSWLEFDWSLTGKVVGWICYTSVSELGTSTLDSNCLPA